MAHLGEILIQHDGERFSEEKWQCVADALTTGRTSGAVKQKAGQIKKATEAAEEEGSLAVRADAVASGIHPTGVGPPRVAPAQCGIKRQSGPRISLPGMAPRKMLASQANKDEWAAKVDAAAKAAAAAAAEADTDYDVSEILGIRKGWDDQGHDDDSFEFQVKWSTGEPSIMLENCRDMVKDFLVEAVWPLKINITAPEIKKPKIKKNKVKAPKIKKNKVKKMKVKGTPSTPRTSLLYVLLSRSLFICFTVSSVVSPAVHNTLITPARGLHINLARRADVARVAVIFAGHT